MDLKKFKGKYEVKEVKENLNNVNQNPLVSVCVQTYKHVNYIKQCLDGILFQKTNFEFEILLGEDDSNDGTRELCEDYAKRYPDKIRLFLHHRENNIKIGGQPTGRFNFLYNLHSSKGKYIALCEGDDYWTDPLKLQKQVDFLEENPGYVVTSHNARVINTTGETLKQRKLPKLISNTSYSQQALKKGMHLLTLTMVYRNVNFISYFEEDFQNILNADTYLISCLGFYGKGMYLDDIQDACYRVHDGGVWSKKSEFIKFKNLINTYSSLYKLHVHENSEPNVLQYFEKLLSTLSNKMILNADKRISFTEFKNSIPIYFKFSENSQNYTVIKAILLLIYRKLNLNILRKKLKQVCLKSV
jgi:glycosyltransferase involved in cell wall biosynthesis